ncbi:galactokinase [Paenibacillus mucilaginosus]|uniref:Galactokinase n=3 Tax=Paenibacillus mucilaginosus TaxID=61624 RepID=H6NBM5_9BACL|nr:galactokinase [Paenibacillus mucilaginosus]AEI46176.1 GalK [Paenibacillus mucilaginosus KNP414]AFC33794.1 GalK [Paenibacillus mucilaginosus 3016]AFH66124.1 galactokinase [Paenibacillus mucilaginosus K02]MCG7213692.1 galactokinase [Paenibacillus mucilaginosus]WDM27504.1 galactokinase [Paenibacillus mucilaginosus]
MSEVQVLKEQFIELYGAESAHEIRVFHAPGRVNLIGEHTDYNGGYVFPAALTFGTTLVMRRRDDGMIGFASTNFPLRKQISITDIEYRAEDDWTNYPKGVIKELQDRGVRVGGYDLLFSGAIPNGSGLSSSASIEVVTAYGVLTMEGQPVDTVDISLLSQKAENEFIGVKCGIMDQFAVANGKKDHAILLMCDTLEYKHVPFKSGAYKLVIGNTNKKRGLVDSAYNERRAQCEQAVKDLQVKFPDLRLLGQLSLEQFMESQDLIQDPVVRKRAQHVVEEIHRVLHSVRVLEEDDLVGFGELMIGSHNSLRDLYEVTGFELDTMVEAALEVPGVLGSRMTGAGFGGCTVSLVHQDSVERFIEEVGQVYKNKTGLTADFYVCNIGDGVKEIEVG